MDGLLEDIVKLYHTLSQHITVKLKKKIDILCMKLLEAREMIENLRKSSKVGGQFVRI